jgi:hypothetical protein
MDEISLFTAVRPAARSFDDADRAAARRRLLAAAADEQAAKRAFTGWASIARARRRRWLAGIPAAAGIAAAVLLATSIGRPGENVGPVRIGPAPAEAALVFKNDGRYIDVIVRNPVADPKRYQAEFKAHGLKITLRLVPASPSLVGTVVFVSTEGPGGNSIQTITAKGRCRTGAGGSRCPVGLRVPIGYAGQAAFTFGRAARPGEQYGSYAPAGAPGEAMHGLHFRGKTVAAVLAMLRRRQVTAVFEDFRTGRMLSAAGVPGTWHVYAAVPWAPHEVLLRVAASHPGP